MSPVAFAVVGSEMVGFTVTGLLIDWLTGWMPWTTVVLTVLGLVAAMIHLARIVQKPAGKQDGPTAGGP